MSNHELIAHYLALYGPAKSKEVANKLHLHESYVARALRRMHSDKHYGIARADKRTNGGLPAVWKVKLAEYKTYLAKRGKSVPVSLPLPTTPPPSDAPKWLVSELPKLTRWMPSSPYYQVSPS